MIQANLDVCEVCLTRTSLEFDLHIEDPRSKLTWGTLHGRPGGGCVAVCPSGRLIALFIPLRDADKLVPPNCKYYLEQVISQQNSQ